jgi:hypothetical protein
MAFKFVLLFASLAAVNAGVLQPAGIYQQTAAIFPQQGAIVKQPVYAQAAYQPAYSQPAYQPAYAQPAIVKQLVQPAIVKQVHYAEAPANYEFNYDVHDEHTGDIKQQHEKAVNGAITGQYSLIDADGYRRIVDYTADDVHGFNANVRREPLHQQNKIIVQQPIAVQKVIAQPIAVQKVIAQPALNAWQQPAQNAWQQPARNPWQ